MIMMDFVICSNILKSTEVFLKELSTVWHFLVLLVLAELSLFVCVFVFGEREREDITVWLAGLRYSFIQFNCDSPNTQATLHKKKWGLDRPTKYTTYDLFLKFLPFNLL